MKLLCFYKKIMSDHPSVIALEQVIRIYSKGQCGALNDITLSIEPNEYMAIMGPSAAGSPHCCTF
jgi:ABC-type ATPase involved in cell division